MVVRQDMAAIELKSSRRFRREYLAGLRALQSGAGGSVRGYIVYRGDAELEVDGYWRPDNYERDRKFGSGFHLNQNSPAMSGVATHPTHPGTAKQAPDPSHRSQ